MVALTNYNITPAKGQAAFLPNQPILHNCVVDPEAATPLTPGAVVTFKSTSLTDLTVVKQAAVTDEPCGIVVYNPIKSSFAANERVSIFPIGSFVYMPAAAATIVNGEHVGFNSSNQAATDSTATHYHIGVAYTQAASAGDMIVVRIQPELIPSA